MYDSGITKDEELAIVSGLHQFHEYFPERDITNYGRERWTSGSHSSADWYVINNKMRSPSGQIDAYGIILEMMAEPWQALEKHIDVLIVSEDISAMYDGDWVDYCLSRTCGRFIVISVARFRELDRYDKAAVIKSVLWHELGHVMGLAGNLLRKHTIDASGSHCSIHGCIMQPGETVEDFLAHAKEAAKIGRIYCSLCLEDAKNTLC